MERVVEFLVVFSLIFTIFLGSISGNIVQKKFEYKYSFKPPYLAQKDGSVPFWEYGGSKYTSVKICVKLRHTFLYGFTF